MKFTYKIACGMMCCLLFVGTAFSQQKRSAADAAGLKATYGSNYEEVLQKYGDNPLALQQKAFEQQAGLRSDPFYFIQQDERYIVRAENEPNDFFDTADNIDDVLSTPTSWAPSYGISYSGGLIQASFTAGDFDVYSFNPDPGKMYYFGGTHSFPGTENFDDESLGISALLFHESDLDTTFVTGFGGIEGNDQISGVIMGETTDFRAGSGDFRLTGWTMPVTNPETLERLTGTYYLFVYNGEGGGSPSPINSLGNTGTYHIGAYAIDLEPLVSRFEPNQTFEEALINSEARVTPDGVMHQLMAYNQDTVKVVISGVTGGVRETLPLQSNAVYPQLYAQGDEDFDIIGITDLKVNHTLLVETLPFLGYYRDPDGTVGPGNTRWSDPLMVLFDAEYANEIASSDDNGREEQSADGSPNNIHPRFTYLIEEADLGAPVWVRVSGWASNARNPNQSVDNRDPGRFVYRFYAHQYANDLTEANSEPNNTVADAMGIVPRTGEAITGNFSDAGDVDMFRVVMNEMRMYNILSFASTVSGPIDIKIYNETADLEGNRTLSDDLLAGSGVVGAAGNDFRVTGFIPPSSGAYLIELSAPSGGDYSLSVVDDAIFNRLINNEPDDTAGDALANDLIEVGVGQPRQEGIVFPAGDVDHYVFSGTAGQLLNIKLQSVGYLVFNDDFQGVISILDAGLNVLATGESASDAMSALNFMIPEDGTYIVQVKAADGTVAGDYGNNAVGLYSLNVGDPPRESEPNDLPENATLLTEGFIAGAMSSTDVDYFRISAEAGNIYHVRGNNNTMGGAMGVDLFLASDPNTSIYDGSGWEGRYSSDHFKVQIIPAEDADYLVRLTPPPGASGAYEIHLKSNDITALAGAYEPNNDLAEADAIGNVDPDGLVHRAMLYNAEDPRFFDDVDYYRVEIEEPGKSLSCETLPFDGPFWGRDSDMYTRVLDAQGNVLGENDDNSVTLEDGTTFSDWHSRTTVPITEAGVYYCLIGSQDFLDDADGGDDRDPTSGEYKFRISYTGDEAEPNNEVANATLLQAFSTTNARLEEGDVDVFAMNLKAGNIYHVRTFRGEGVGSFETGAMLSTEDDPGTDITDSAEGGWRTRNNGSNVKLNIIPDEDKTYYLTLTAPAELGDSTYQVLIKSNPIEALASAGEPNNTFDEADAQPEHPADGAVYQYMLYDANVDGFHDDLDYYRIDANAGDIITAETLPFDGPTWPRDFDAYMYLYGPDREPVATNATNDDNAVTLEDGSIFDDWHSKIEYTVQTAGTHYFLVVGQDAAVPPREQTESRWRDPARGEYKFRLTKVTGVGVEDDPATPHTFALDQNYPNPFNPTTTISYSIPESAEVELAIYDILGQRVATLVNGQKAAGSYQVNFDASQLASGMYLYRIVAGKNVSVKKMLLVK